MKLTLFSLVLFISPFGASIFASPSTSVWTQMQNGSTTPVLGKIRQLRVTSSGVEVVYAATRVSQESTETVSLCNDFSDEYAGQHAFESEPNKFMHHESRLRDLRAAKQTGERVELRLSGPWSPCLESIEFLSAR